MTYLLAQGGPTLPSVFVVFPISTFVLLMIFACLGSRFPIPDFRLRSLGGAFTGLFLGVFIVAPFIWCCLFSTLLNSSSKMVTGAALSQFIGCIVAFSVARISVGAPEKPFQISLQYMFVIFTLSIGVVVLWVYMLGILPI